MNNRKHKFTNAEYKVMVEKVVSLKSTMTVAKACESLGISIKLYSHARQMLLRGKPMTELGFKFPPKF